MEIKISHAQMCQLVQTGLAEKDNGALVQLGQKSEAKVVRVEEGDYGYFIIELNEEVSDA